MLEKVAPEKKDLHERRPRIWLDRAFEKPSDDFLTRKIYPALDHSTRLIVISTPSAFETTRGKDGSEEPNWLVREIDRFVGAAGAQIPQRPVDVVVGPGGAADHFPGRLASTERWDWIDCRHFSWCHSLGLSEELDVACTKLVAGLYDVPEAQLPALRREERRRRNRRMLSVLTATTLIALVIGVLSVIAWQQKRNADRNSKIADARRQTAEAELIISQQPVRTGVGVLLAAEAVAGFRDLNLDSPDASEMVRRGMALLPRIKARQSFKSPAVTVSRNRAVFAKGGRYFAVSDNERKVQVLDAMSVDRMRTLVLDGPVNYLRLSGNGRYLLTATGLNAAANPALWDLSREQPEKVFEARLKIRVATISAEGRYLMFSGDDGASVWDGPTGSAVCPLPNGSSVLAAEFSPDRKQLAVSYSGQGGSPRVILFNAGTWETLSTMVIERAADILAFSPDSRYVALASGLGPLISIWDLVTGNKISSVSHSGGNGVDNISFSPKGTFLATSGYDQVARIWDPKAGTEVIRIQGSSLPYQVDFSPDEKYVVTAFIGDKVARVWRTNNGAEVARMSHGDPILKAAFLSDGTGLATAGSDGFLRIWTMPVDGLQAHELADQLEAVALSSGGRYMSTLDSNGSSDEPPLLHVWDFGVGKEIFSMQLPPGAHGSIAVGSTNRRGTAVSRDGRRVAAVGYWGAGHEAYVWDTGSMRSVFHADAPAPIDSVVLSPDGQYLGTISKGEGKLWDIRGQRSFLLGQSPISDLEFSPDSPRIVVVEPGKDRDSCLKEQRLPTGHQLVVLKLTGALEDIAISHRDRLLAATDGTKVRIMDIAACRTAYNFEEKETITALAFDETEGLIAAATAQGSAQIWRLRTNDRVYRVHHEGYLATVAFSYVKDGEYLLTANGYLTRQQGEFAPNHRNSVRLWQWQQRDILAYACQVLGSYTVHEFPQDQGFDVSVGKICQKSLTP